MPPFDLIPVIDLKHGKAVRATGGNRADYRPLATRLCPDGAPLSAARGLLGLHPFARLYIADLDAIDGGEPQIEVLRIIGQAFPGLELWVDAGLADQPACADWLAHGLARPVLGSESLADPSLPSRVDGILSLDFRGERFLGPAEVLADAALWPRTLIVMCLHSVGTNAGPDMARLKSIIGQAGSRRVYAAGGVRTPADLQALAAAGAAGALIASALHAGAISGADLRRFANTANT